MLQQKRVIYQSDHWRHLWLNGWSTLAVERTNAGQPLTAIMIFDGRAVPFTPIRRDFDDY